MARRRRDDLGSAWSLEDHVQVETWEREGNRRRNYCRGGAFRCSLSPVHRSLTLVLVRLDKGRR